MHNVFRGGTDSVNTMYNKKMIAMMLTLSMLAASLAGCAGGDDDDDADGILDEDESDGSLL
mgnify:CR=1 FL=1